VIFEIYKLAATLANEFEPFKKTSLLSFFQSNYSYIHLTLAITGWQTAM